MTDKPIKRITIALALAVLLAALFAFSAGALMRGDINEDGAVTPADARLALRISVGLIDLPSKATATDATATDATATDATATDATATDATATDATATDAELTDAERIARMTDIADIDLDGAVKPDDARAILRMAVNLREKEPYFAPRIVKEATCTEDGVCERISTEPMANEEDARFEQTIPALGHTTRLGICANCHRYQDGLLEHYRTQIVPSLNNGVKALKAADRLLREKNEADVANGTITIGEAKNLFITAYNHYCAAYTACGSDEEFKEAKELLYTICRKLLEIIYTGEITESNYSTVYNKWIGIADGILDPEAGDNMALKAITVGYKDPAENSTSAIHLPDPDDEEESLR